MDMTGDIMDWLRILLQQTSQSLSLCLSVWGGFELMGVEHLAIQAQLTTHTPSGMVETGRKQQITTSKRSTLYLQHGKKTREEKNYPLYNADSLPTFAKKG